MKKEMIKNRTRYVNYDMQVNETCITDKVLECGTYIHTYIHTYR